MIYLVSFFPQYMQTSSAVFRGAKDCKKVIHWVGEDVESLMRVPYKPLKDLVKVLKETIDKHYVSYENSRQMLAELGIEAEIQLLPEEYKEVAQPEKFQIFYEIDNATQDFMMGLIRSNPDFDFGSPNIYKFEEYSAYISLSGSEFPTENLKKFIMAGRPVITNYKLPYANFVELDREKVVRKIRELKKNPYLSPEAKEYWIAACSPDNFIKKVRSLI